MAKARVIWAALGVAFAVTLAVVVGQRLSSEAMAVIVGVVAGVAASIPTSLIVVWVATRNSPRPPVMPEAHSAGPVYRTQPDARPVVVVQQPVPANYPLAGGVHPALHGPVPGAGYAGPRRYTVVGGAGRVSGDDTGFQEVVWEE